MDDTSLYGMKTVFVHSSRGNQDAITACDEIFYPPVCRSQYPVLSNFVSLMPSHRYQLWPLRLCWKHEASMWKARSLKMMWKHK